MLILTVAEVTTYINEVLAADQLLGDLWLQGEVSNLSRSTAGHRFFTLKDAESQMRCVLFRHQAQFQTYQPENGDLVVAHGKVSLYEANGALQLYVDLVQPAGVGEAHLAFEQLRQKLAAEGLFEAGRKRPLPRFPRCLGVVTSAQGAVWHDIVSVVDRRYPLVEVILSPAQVQGDGAPASIETALRRLWQLGRCDVIIVGRGGGSAEDLAAFNDERVARAIYASPVPIISAVGHDVDVTIADFVADLRAPTPSAAAELAVPDRRQLLAEVLASEQRLRTVMIDRWQDERDHLSRVAQTLRRLAPRARLAVARREIDGTTRRLATEQRHRLALQQQRLAALSGALRALDPTAVLGRGYAVVRRDDDGRVISAAHDVTIGDGLRIALRHGEITARVETTGERDAER